MRFINKLFVNTGLFSILALLIIVPIVAVTMTGFNPSASETSEVLSAQDRSVEEAPVYEELPSDLEEIIRRVEMEMAKEAAESAGIGNLEIGN